MHRLEAERFADLFGGVAKGETHRENEDWEA
jgi:hypothetical protein